MFKVLMMCAALIAAGVCYSGEDESVVGPLDVIEIGEDNVCGTSRERLTTLRISNNAGEPPLNVTRGTTELMLATLTPSRDYYRMNSTMSILMSDFLIEDVHLPMGNMTQGEEKTYNSLFFIPAGAATGEAQIKFEIFNDDYSDILCFIIDTLIS